MDIIYQNLMANFDEEILLSEVVSKYVVKSSESSFEHQYLDKFAFPTHLYDTNTEFNLGIGNELENEQNENDFLFAFWEGSYRDKECSDYFHISYKTFIKSVQSVIILLQENGISKGDLIPFFSPSTIQVPIILCASMSLGAIYAPFNPESYKDEEDLAVGLKVLKTPPKLVITIDGYYNGTTFNNTKAFLDKALQLAFNRDLKCFVIRHAAPHPGIPKPRKTTPGRRPNYDIILPWNNSKDFKWNLAISQISSNHNNYQTKFGNTLLSGNDNILFSNSTYINVLQFVIIAGLYKKVGKYEITKDGINPPHLMLTSCHQPHFLSQIYSLVWGKVPFLVTELLISEQTLGKRFNYLFSDYNVESITIPLNMTMTLGPFIGKASVIVVDDEVRTQKITGHLLTQPITS
uniref:AMP-binding domain-containing protein n=1 Tax=Rhabditophanes sp. KR3021 TaxID=114890 RepID=A0AC35TTX5_9BILA